LVEQNSGFYTQLAQLAKQQGITMSVIGIKGDSINMDRLGVLADTTGGEVDIVDPLQITNNFSSILETKLVATDVIVKLFLHKGFTFPQDGEWISDTNQLGEKGKRQLFAVRNIGNAFEDTEITAEFTEAPAEIIAEIFEGSGKVEKGCMEIEKEEIPSHKVEKKDEKKELPFQVQVTYRALSGMKCTRVITKTKEVSGDSAEVEKEIDVTVLGMHANYISAQKAQQGDLKGAIETTAIANDLMQANLDDDIDTAGYAVWVSDATTFSKEVESAQPDETSKTDAYSNMIYNRKNAKKNKKTWSARRKY